jgi:hypothetical protein
MAHYGRCTRHGAPSRRPVHPSASEPRQRSPCFRHITGALKFQINLLSLRNFHRCGPSVGLRRRGTGRLGTKQPGKPKRGRGRFPTRSPITHMAPLVRPLAMLIALAGLSACASISEKFANTMSQAPVVGLPDDAPQRPATAAAYPAVHDMPPPRQSAVLTELEQQKLEKDLVAARQVQQGKAGTSAARPKNRAEVKAQKPPVPPVSTGAAIY